MNQGFEKETASLLELIKNDANNAEYHYANGGIYDLPKNREKAIYYLNKSIELAPNNHMYYIARSLATDSFAEQEI